MTRILVLEHDASDPLLRLGGWLADAGADVHVLRLHAGDALPADLTGYDAVLSLGGDMGAYDDDIAPWLPATRALLARAVAERTPTLAICLGSQLLAAATGGTVTKGADGPEIGAYLTAKRDAAENDPLFDPLPMTPDVMHYHYDVVSTLPPGAVLLLSSTGYPHQAWRIGSAAWGLQFHIEPSAADLRAWGRSEGREPIGRLGPVLDQAEEAMGEVWRDFVARFVRFASGQQTGLRLPLLGLS
jgi:GMP synthase-like glutamine amidotransferase